MKIPEGARVYGKPSFGTRAVAVYLGGIDPGKVNNWIHSDTIGFPKPDVTTLGPDSVSGYSWYMETLPSLRAWWDLYNGTPIAEATAYWQRLDELIEVSPRRGDIRMRREAPQIPGQTSVEL